MASSYSTDLKLELMVTGENAGTWGDKTNTNLNLVQQAIAGVEAITLSDGGTKALVMTDGTISDARNMVLKLATITLGSASNLTIPDGIEKFYILDATAVTNPTNLTFKTASGTGFTLDAAKIYAAYSDGTNIKEVSLDTLGGTIGTAQVADNTITAAKISSNAVTTAKILQSNVTTAKLAQNAVTANQITQSTITQAKLAANSVGPNQLQSTAVTAGDYTVASITVDEDGRLTAASSGSAGGGAFQLSIAASGPDSGNFTANPATNVITAFAAGGGGGQGYSPGGYSPGRSPGGSGAAGYFIVPITQPFGPQPWNAGGGGSSPAQAGSSGGSGGTSSLANTNISAPGGGGGSGGAPNTGSSNNITPSPTALDMKGNNFFSSDTGVGGPGTGGNGFLLIYENIAT